MEKLDYLRASGGGALLANGRQEVSKSSCLQ